jgi:amino acid transporter
VFFWTVITVVAYVTPWPTLQINQQFPTAVAFERALHAHWIVDLIMASALVALLQAFNANLVASSRLLYAMGRRHLLDARMSRVHPRNQTPSTAILAVGVATAFAMLLGEAGLVPILEVGAVASALGWMAGCAAYWCMKPELRGRTAAAFGLLVTTLMVMVKVLPMVPGHFTRYEWIAMGVWAALGIFVRARRDRADAEPKVKSRMEKASV